jgi:hypothetical protein
VELVLDSAEHADLQPLGKLDSLEVLLVLPIGAQLLGLPERAAKQGRTQASPLEEDGDGGAETAGADN